MRRAVCTVFPKEIQISTTEHYFIPIDFVLFVIPRQNWIRKYSSHHQIDNWPRQFGLIRLPIGLLCFPITMQILAVSHLWNVHSAHLFNTETIPWNVFSYFS